MKIKFLLVFFLSLVISKHVYSDQVEQRNILVLNTYQYKDKYLSIFKDLQLNKTYKQESCYKLKKFKNKQLYVFYDISRNMYFITCPFI